jgi:hypothetical protein
MTDKPVTFPTAATGDSNQCVPRDRVEAATKAYQRWAVPCPQQPTARTHMRAACSTAIATLQQMAIGARRDYTIPVQNNGTGVRLGRRQGKGKRQGPLSPDSLSATSAARASREAAPISDSCKLAWWWWRWWQNPHSR